MLLTAIGHSGTIGFAVCDQRLQFQVVNDAWAKMDGVPREGHPGATIREVLGPAGEKFEWAFKRVFSTGKPLLDYEFSTELSTRTEEGHWITSCFPLKAPPERPKLAAAVILETTQLRRLESWSHKLLRDSVRLLEVLFETEQLLGDAFKGMSKPVNPAKTPHKEQITPRELEVIQLLARSKSNKEVAETL